ncbi:MAG: hypothetical protein ACKVY0_08120 [Prosthecobacter sp.]|uniref:hypothetical protein n=1 Tax=Prosthecobacter sp. TaxID=1965333 RepID=UPI0039038AFB
MSYIPGTIKAARLKQPRLTTEQFYQQVERHLGISLTRPVCSESGGRSVVRDTDIDRQGESFVFSP